MAHVSTRIIPIIVPIPKVLEQVDASGRSKKLLESAGLLSSSFRCLLKASPELLTLPFLFGLPKRVRQIAMVYSMFWATSMFELDFFEVQSTSVHTKGRNKRGGPWILLSWWPFFLLKDGRQCQCRARWKGQERVSRCPFNSDVLLFDISWIYPVAVGDEGLHLGIPY